MDQILSCKELMLLLEMILGTKSAVKVNENSNEDDQTEVRG